MDDTTLSEIIVNGDCSKISTIMSDVINWTSNNLMNINWDKTKEMLMTTSKDMLCDALCVSNNMIERVHSYKKLGVTIDNNLKWCSHVNSVCAKASSRLHFLKILKLCSLSTDNLLYFYNSAVRPVLEYACPAWHTSLTKEQSSQIELIQKRAFRIIFSSNCLDYENFCFSV